MIKVTNSIESVPTTWECYNHLNSEFNKNSSTSQLNIVIDEYKLTQAVLSIIQNSKFSEKDVNLRETTDMITYNTDEEHNDGFIAIDESDIEIIPQSDGAFDRRKSFLSDFQGLWSPVERIQFSFRDNQVYPTSPTKISAKSIEIIPETKLLSKPMNHFQPNLFASEVKFSFKPFKDPPALNYAFLDPSYFTLSEIDYISPFYSNMDDISIIPFEFGGKKIQFKNEPCSNLKDFHDRPISLQRNDTW